MALNQKVIRGLEYLPAIWQGENKSGAIPIGDRVLILPDIAIAQTESGVHIPDEFKERMQLGSESGVVVALGDDAFAWNSDRTRPFQGYKPKPGDRVHFEKYAGRQVNGDDGVTYRLVDDRSVGAIIEIKK